MTTKKRKTITAKTKMQTIVDIYGLDFGSDNALEAGEFLRKRGYSSLAKLLDKEQNQ